MDIRDLLAKGDGTLVRTNGVWSYPGAPLDPSGSNLRLPIEHVSDAEVLSALHEEIIVVAVTNPDGSPVAMRLKGDGSRPIITTAQAGTADAGTELPAGSRPSVDAGAAPAEPEDDAKVSPKKQAGTADAGKGR